MLCTLCVISNGSWSKFFGTTRVRLISSHREHDDSIRRWRHTIATTATATVAMIVHDDVGDDHRSATATTGGGRSWSPESSRQESTVHRFVAGPSQFLPDRRVVDFFRILANSSSSRQFHAKPVVDPRRRVAPRRAAPTGRRRYMTVTHIPRFRYVRDTVIPTGPVSRTNENRAESNETEEQ